MSCHEGNSVDKNVFICLYVPHPTHSRGFWFTAYPVSLPCRPGMMWKIWASQSLRKPVSDHSVWSFSLTIGFIITNSITEQSLDIFASLDLSLDHTPNLKFSQSICPLNLNLLLSQEIQQDRPLRRYYAKGCGKVRGFTPRWVVRKKENPLMITLEFWLHICWILCTRFCKSTSSSIQFWLSICKICKVPPRKPKCGSRLPKKGKLVTSKFTVTTWGTIRLFPRQETTHICQDITKNNFLGLGLTSNYQVSLAPLWRRIRISWVFGEHATVWHALQLSGMSYSLQVKRARTLRHRSIGGTSMRMNVVHMVFQRAVWCHHR